MKKLFLTFILALFMISFASAFVLEAGKTADLNLPCSDIQCNGACNVSVFYPNSSLAVENQAMTLNNIHWNYTLNENQTNPSGFYDAMVLCVSGNSTQITYEITPSGETVGVAEAILYGFILLLMFGIGGFFMAFATATEQDGVKLFFYLVSFASVMLAIGTSRRVLDYTSMLEGMSNLVMSAFWMLGIIFIISMYLVFLNTTRRALELMRAKGGFPDITNPEQF